MPTVARRTRRLFASHSATRPRARRLGLAAVAAALTVSVAGCGAFGGSTPDASADKTNPTKTAAAQQQEPDDTEPTPEATPTPTPTGSVTIKAGESTNSDAKIDLITPITVTADKASITSVKVTGSNGTTVAGAFTSDRAAWASAPDTVLGSSTTYTIKAEAKGTDGLTTKQTKTFTTKSMSILSSDITPENGETVGVGMPIVIRFGAAVTNKAAVEKELVVTSTSKANGAWHWVNGSEVHYRTEHYWPAGTDVTLKMNLRGVKGSDSAIGIVNKVKNFHVGSSRVSKISLKSHQLKYYVNGKLDRTIPVTGGKPGWETRSGTKLVLERRTDVNMRSETVGVADKNDPDFYDLRVKWALRVTWSGEFLHSAPWSVGSQGAANVSHGCVGMSEANQYYLWKSAQRGDPVETTGSSKQMPAFGNGMGDWNLSWSAWKAGSAL